MRYRAAAAAFVAAFSLACSEPPSGVALDGSTVFVSVEASQTHLEVLCFSVNGNRAWIAGRRTTDNPDGLESGFWVEDNGNGAPGDLPDRASLLWSGQPAGFAQWYCDNQVIGALLAVFELEAGNIDIAPDESQVSGSGSFHVTTQSGDWRTLSFTATRHPDGTTSGQVQILRRENPWREAWVVAGDTRYRALEGNVSTPLRDEPRGRITGTLVPVGLGCNATPLTNDPAGKIALIERGSCGFTEKLQNVLTAGATGAIVYNDAAGGDEVIIMGGARVMIPAVFVGRTSGLALLAAAPLQVIVQSCPPTPDAEQCHGV